MSRPAAGPGISRCLLRQQTQMPSYSDCLVPCDVLSSFPIFLTPPPPHHLHRHRLSQSFRRLRSTFRRFTSAIFSFFLAAISAPLTSAPFHFFCSSPSARAVVPLNQNRQIAVPSFLLSGGGGCHHSDAQGEANQISSIRPHLYHLLPLRQSIGPCQSQNGA